MYKIFLTSLTRDESIYTHPTDRRIYESGLCLGETNSRVLTLTQDSKSKNTLQLNGIIRADTAHALIFLHLVPVIHS